MALEAPMPDAARLSEAEADYLREMVNIGAGHAAKALSQMLKCRMEMKVPRVQILPPRQASSLLGDLPVVCVKMGMVGDVRGEIFLVIPEREKEEMARMAEAALLGPPARKGPADVFVLEEVGNVVAGAYLAAIHDFCGLNIFHTIPASAIDTFQPLVDELVAGIRLKSNDVLVMENEFTITIEGELKTGKRRVSTLFIVFPSPESTGILLESIKNAMPE